MKTTFTGNNRATSCNITENYDTYAAVHATRGGMDGTRLTPRVQLLCAELTTFRALFVSTPQDMCARCSQVGILIVHKGAAKSNISPNLTLLPVWGSPVTTSCGSEPGMSLQHRSYVLVCAHVCMYVSAL